MTAFTRPTGPIARLRAHFARGPLEPVGFGVGAAKTGTHSLASLFATTMRAEHEPDADALIALVLAHKQGELDGRAFANKVRALFARQRLAFNISQINGYIVDTLVKLYPDARFVLTVRAAEPWLRSLVNHQLTRPQSPQSAWARFRDLRFETNDPIEPQLAAKNLYALDGYLSYWRWHNANVIAAVPRDKLLVVPTPAIAREGKAIAAFLGVDPFGLDVANAHDYTGRYVESPLDALDRGYVEDKLRSYTEQLLAAAPLNRGNAARLEEAVTAKEPKNPTDVARWSKNESFDPKWALRSKLAAKYIPGGSTVLDVGCGTMFIERELPPGCRYIPSDVVRRDERTLVCDLNLKQYPHVEGVTHITALGVMEYLKDLPDFWRWVRSYNVRFVTSYVLLTPHLPAPRRRAQGWINDLTETELLALAQGAGFRLAARERIRDANQLFVFDPV